MGRLAGKVAVVTGAATGMGRAIAELFIKEGARVVIVDRSGKEGETAAALGPSAVGVHADVSSSVDVQNMIKTAEDRWGKLDVLVNNAGFGGGLNRLADFPDEHFDKVVNTNLRGVFLGMKYGIQAMLRNGGGSIVNTSSISGMAGWAGHSIYGAAKAGVIQMTRCAALEYAKDNIRVNSVAPGTTWTSVMPDYANVQEPPEGAIPPFEVPMPRFGKSSEIAYATLFFACDESSFVTGTVLPVDGGYIAGPAKHIPEYPRQPGEGRTEGTGR